MLSIEHVLWLCNFWCCKAIIYREAALLYCKATLPRAQISETEAAHIPRSCAGKREPRKKQYEISMARVIDNLEVDRLRRRVLLKRGKRGKGKLLKLQGMASGEQCVMLGWAGGVGAAIGGGEATGEDIFTKPTAHEISLEHDSCLVSHNCGF